MYVAGHVLELDQQIMSDGKEEEKQRHIIEIAQLFACEFAGNVLSNVDRVINVNVEAELPQVRRRKKELQLEKKELRREELPGPQLLPSVNQADAPLISFQEARDFVRIDLNLIDRKEYFDRFFGVSNN
jgi:hypothetical protein